MIFIRLYTTERLKPVIDSWQLCQLEAQKAVLRYDSSLGIALQSLDGGMAVVPCGGGLRKWLGFEQSQGLLA